MSAARTFEELECWQLARELNNAVYAFTKSGSAAKDYAFIDQIRRAAMSVMNNISEGHERGSNKDFVKFLYIARGSAGEVRNMCYIGLDQQYLNQIIFDKTHDLATRTSKACYGLIRYLSQNLDWKSKFSIFYFLLLLPLSKPL
ncbi:MAG TPA: four helix bundle protein [Kiritimatiellia bacterium]|nr:four helix bundle protein [Kiritimatiellia bacterium]